MVKCLSCAEPIRVGDKYFHDVSGDVLHDECAGNDCFVDLHTEEPISYRPDPSIWTQADQDMEDDDEMSFRQTPTGETIQ